MYVVAIVAAAGEGRRFGAATPKQLVTIRGETVLSRSVSAFLRHPRVSEVIVVLPPALAGEPPLLPPAGSKPLRIVPGGARRQDSVANGFDATPDAADIVIVHDAARPLVDAATIDRAIDGAARYGAAIAAVPARDTVKVAEVGESDSPRIVSTVDRERVWLAQTPQAFARPVLADAVRKGRDGASGTDEATLAEQAGHEVRLVPGDAMNVKITTPADFAYAEYLLAETPRGSVGPQRSVVESPSPDASASRSGAMRIGIGYDSHRLIAGRPLVLGGMSIPHERGLTGHSDADALCHAITDAILGAAALGDIGRHFPDTDPRWKDANSLELLSQSVMLIHAAGFRVANVDAVVVAESPRLAPHVDAIRAKLASALHTSVDAVSVKGKTNEGMGEAGRGEGIAVHAVALLVLDVNPQSAIRNPK
jgi:2-C-methyl-D-erythritol 4-phosphate cytidylyltransferase/2-C-methyl-D-erythritol 2,4-cyclodiphosphate synthase